MNIVIFYGGKSSEHDISIITGCLAKGYFQGNVLSVYVDENGKSFLVDNKVSPSEHIGKGFKKQVVFPFGLQQMWITDGKRIAKKVAVDIAVNAMHGVNGEDGSLAGVMQLACIPLVGSGVLPSAIAMDKYLTKLLLKATGKNVIDGIKVCKDNYKTFVETASNFPLIVKPLRLGSSIGITVAKDVQSLTTAIETALTFDNEVVVEKALTNYCELNCAVAKLGNEIVVSRVDKPLQSDEILSFKDKYISGSCNIKGAKGVLPDLLLDFVSEVKSTSKDIYTVFNFSGVIRVDYLFDFDTSSLYVNEINAIPGSLAYNLFEDNYSRKEYGELLISGALQDYSKSQNITYTFSSSVLKQNYSIKK